MRYRLSKHKMTTYSKYLGGMPRCHQGYAYGLHDLFRSVNHYFVKKSNTPLIMLNLYIINC